MNDDNIPKYMQNDKIFIAVFIAILSPILFEYRILGDIMIFPFLIALLYLIPIIFYRSFLYLANNNSLWTRLILVSAIIIFVFVFIWLVFFIDIETCQYLFHDAVECQLVNKIGLGFIYSVGIASISISLLVLVHKILTFIKNG